MLGSANILWTNLIAILKRKDNLKLNWTEVAKDMPKE